MIEIEKNKPVNTYVVCPSVTGDVSSLSENSRLAEIEGLARAINLNVLHKEIIHLREIKPAMYFSRGFIERISPDIQDKSIELLVVDARLSPIQQRNLERELKVKVIDRTALILEIFGERAQTREGSLQVELAHLTYQRSRLVRSWTHLERQRGGAGFLGGPGETQIELDRRLIDDKIIRIKKDLEKVKKTREIQRGARRKIPYPIVALVGYTNAGKSTLFNYLTKSDVLAADMLFATLDPTMRKIRLPNGMEVILSDTVGFISDLPHELIMAFRATLEEVLNSDVILHVRDISNPDAKSQKKDVLDVLENLGLKDIKYADNYLEVMNKSDLLSPDELAYWQNKTMMTSSKVLISAYTGYGKEKLLNLISQKLAHDLIDWQVSIPVEEGRLSAWLYKNSRVNHVENNENLNTYRVSISQENIAKFAKMAEKHNTVSMRKE